MVKSKQLRQAQEEKIQKACAKLRNDQQAGNARKRHQRRKYGT
jgi:hypothetical protein